MEVVVSLRNELLTNENSRNMDTHVPWKKQKKKKVKICQRSPEFPVMIIRFSTNSPRPTSTAAPWSIIQESTPTKRQVVRCVKVLHESIIDSLFNSIESIIKSKRDQCYRLRCGFFCTHVTALFSYVIYKSTLWKKWAEMRIT